MAMVMVEHLVAVGRDVVASEPPTPTPSGGTSIAKSTIISVVICALFLLVCLCGYIHGHCRRVDDGSAAPGGGRASSGRGKRGLDQSVVATFPILPWRDHHKKEKRVMKEECCPVCLTAFEEDDNLRLLPHCSHMFHPECIDPWLQARETCPLCRANLEKPLPADAVAIPAEEAMELEMLRTERRAARLLAEGS